MSEEYYFNKLDEMIADKMIDNLKAEKLHSFH